jgi:sarcosine oxidase
VPEIRRFVVVGAGLVGLAVTRELARRGHDVLCLEQAAIGHERAGSKGSSRVFRYTYEDPAYVRMAMRSLAGWQELSEEAGRQLLEPTGLLSIGDRLPELCAGMDEGGAAYEMLVGDEVTERFPMIRVPGAALFEATAGVLHADAILAALARSARAAGAEIVEGARVSGAEERSDGVRLRAGGLEYDCAAAVMCGGAWSGDLAKMAGLAVGGVFRPTLQQVAYLQPRPTASQEAPAAHNAPPAHEAPPADEAPAAHNAPPADEAPAAHNAPAPGHWDGTPAFVERGPVVYYGAPAPSLGSYKIGIHDPGGTVSPSEVSLHDDEAELKLLRTAAARLLPGFAEEPVATERCFYDNTPDGHFVIDRVGHVVVGGGTSGHGFKFGPLWAEILADLAEGVPTSVPLERFSFRRFS